MYCKQCRASVSGKVQRCPLCGSALEGAVQGESAFPGMQLRERRASFVLRLSLLLTLVVAAVSVLINYSAYGGGRLWFIFVLGGLVSVWFAIGIAVYKRRNVLKMIVWQVLILGGLSLAWDLLTGFHRWSIHFVIPIICTIAIVAIALLGRVMKQEIRDYLVYLLIAIIFAFSSLLFILYGALAVSLPSYICLGASLLALVYIFAFYGRTFLSELKRRFHM